jgi:hypothetical protein
VKDAAGVDAAKAPRKKRKMSAAGKAAIRAAQKARWAKVNAAKAKSGSSRQPAVVSIISLVRSSTHRNGGVERGWAPVDRLLRRVQREDAAYPAVFFF